MKKIIISLAMIAAVGAVVVGATTAFFSDTETSVGNTFTAGTIDISVDGQNPWNDSWSNYLDKPCETNYMTFTIKNEGENPAKIWKRLTSIVNGPGAINYCEASSEPEWFDGGGTGDESACTGDYIERDTLSAFMIYDMAICVLNEAGGNCPMTLVHTDVNDKEYYQPIIDGTNGWVVVIDEDDQVRVDNVVDTWIQLSEGLGTGESLIVSQSYHLMTWDDSGQPIVTNWAQGDTMEFTVELEARQLTAPAPGVNQANEATAELVEKNTTTWDPIPGGATVTLTYVVEGEMFDYSFAGTVVADGDYQLIYYPDPWASPKTVVVIGAPVTSASLAVAGAGNVELSTDLPASYDNNYGVGAKVWLVPTSSLSGNQLLWTNLGQFLFDLTMVNYDDIGA